MSIKDLAAAELQRRLESLSTDDLLRMLETHTRAHVRRRASRSGEHRVERRSEPPPAPAVHRPSSPPTGTLTVGEAVRRAVVDARTPLLSGEIVEAAQALRPGTGEPTIRAEISRMAAAGRLKLAPGPERRFRAA